jgi:hypothetical protein
MGSFGNVLYGSEYHLLRWMGRHRDELNRRLLALLSGSHTTIEWQDFHFRDSTLSPDREIEGIEFLQSHPAYDQLHTAWQNEWPQTGSAQCWDAIGQATGGDGVCWLLVEAKAELTEFVSNCGATGDSKQRISRNLAAFRERHAITGTSDWLKRHYQYANRLWFVDFLERHQIRAVLVEVLFTGDIPVPGRRIPAGAAEWREAIAGMHDFLGVANHAWTQHHVCRLLLPVTGGNA